MDSMEEIYRKHADMVYRYLLSLAKNEDIAEEITQETFYQAVRSIHTFNGEGKITTWLCAIAKNKLYEYYRRHPKQSEPDEEIPDDSSPEKIVMGRIGKLEILKAIHRLSEEQREVVQLRLFGDLSFAEIGEVTRHSENWARVTYYRAKLKLRKELEHE
ncbi:MAG: sigma-70 family RNA polymerase sigma factor [Solobacterium sp.]|nr:sigma-70 family RNA polymerase sigma factor [Solobacterium sp.]